MPRFNANITFMFREYPVVERFNAAKEAGFSAVEILSPEDASIPDLVTAAKTADIDIVLCNAPIGDFLEGGPGLSAVPGREEEFRKNFEMVVAMASAIACPVIHLGPSRIVKDESRAKYVETLVSNVRYAADVVKDKNIVLSLEPLNTFDMPDIFLSRIDDTLDILDRAGCDNVKLQFDIYHMFQMEKNMMSLLEEHIERVVHIQIADSPGRGQPGTGNINFEAIFNLIDKLDYKGWVGTEYMPQGPTIDSLEWLQPYR